MSVENINIKYAVRIDVGGSVEHSIVDHLEPFNKKGN